MGPVVREHLVADDHAFVLVERGTVRVDERGERVAVVSDHGGEVAVCKQFVGQFDGASGESGVVETDRIG